MDGNHVDEEALKDEVLRLERQLYIAREKLNCNAPISSQLPPTETPPPVQTSSFTSHAFLLLSDSALPLGSFAFSSGLESYLAHHPPCMKQNPSTLPTFVSLSLKSLASAILPYLLAAYRSPARLQELDDELDACVLCQVGRRASIAQGRALLTLWQRALKHGYPVSEASTALQGITVGLVSGIGSSSAKGDSSAPMPEGKETPQQLEVQYHAHFPLIWATVCAAMGLDQHSCSYLFLFNHAKAVVSAGIRASVVGPYAAQQLLGSQWLREELGRVIERFGAEVKLEDAGQSVPLMDLWLGRHEMLYSRIFNS